MERYFINSNSLTQFNFLVDPRSHSHLHGDIEMLYLLHGALDLTIEEETFSMEPEDIIVVNANKRHGYQGSDDILIGRFLISYAEINELIDHAPILFWCNSVIDKNEAYDELRAIIRRIIIHNYDAKAESIFYLRSLYYQFLHILTTHFLLTAADNRLETEKNKFENRMNEIIHYIRVNYNRNISLQDLADKLFLSNAYLSRFIKKQFNASFTELVKSVRLHHAMEDLTHTNSTIMKIAMDNGFASVAAFNRAFKDLHKTTPSDFRKSTYGKVKEENKRKEEKINQIIQNKVGACLDEISIVQQDPRDRKEVHVIIDTEAGPSRLRNKNWNRMINAGTAAHLSYSSIQNHILFLKKELGIEYVRFWDIYSPEMLLDIQDTKEPMNFGRIDYILDFLVSNKMKPYFELGFKPFRLLKNVQTALVEIPRKEPFQSLEEMANFYFKLISHLVKRYNAEEVETWYFELWKSEALDYLDFSLNYRPLSEKENAEYFGKFDAVATGIKRLLPNAKIGGGGFSLQHYGRKGLRNILETWKKHEHQPKFISLNFFPYQIEKDGDIYFERKSTDMHFVKNNIDKVKEIVKDVRFEVPEIHVSEFNLTLSNRNVINDYCGKGAFLMQTFIECIDSMEILGYWLGTDLYAEFHDTQTFLFGGVGLLNKTGIPKPAFYAFDFMNRIYKNVLRKGKNYIVTSNGTGSWRIASHNFKNNNYKYFLSSEDEISISDLPTMLEDETPLRLKIKLDGVKCGSYTIKTYSINRYHGSVQDEWVRLGMESDMNMEELEYIKRICTPRLSTKSITIENNSLDLEIVLEPNEMQYLEVTFN